MAATDPALWEVRRAFGVAGGPDEIVLSAEGLGRAFSVGAQIRRGGPAEALEALSAEGADGYLSVRDGARLKRTDLGRFDQVAWGHLRLLGLVESFQDENSDGVRLTTAGARAVASGLDERKHLLARCRRAAAALGKDTHAPTVHAAAADSSGLGGQREARPPLAPPASSEAAK